MQSQFWLMLMQRGSQRSRIDFDQQALAALVPIECAASPAGFSMTTAQIDRLLLVTDRVLRARGSGLFFLAMELDHQQLPIAAVMASKPTLQSACEFLQDYLVHAHPGYRFHFEWDGEGACQLSASLNVALPQARHCHEQLLLAMLFQLLQQFPLEDGTRVYHLQLSSGLLHRYPMLASLGLPLAIDDQRSGIRFDSRILQRPAVGYSRALEVSMHSLLDTMLRQDGRSEQRADLVLDLLLAYLEAGKPAALADIAAAMGCKQRTLQHHLGLEGTSFNQLRGQAQAHFAQCLIAEGRSTDEIVRRLGFSSRSAFHHAFTRMTGMRPAQARRSLRDRPELCVALASEPPPGASAYADADLQPAWLHT